MCGICGVLKFANSAPPDPAELDRMNLTLAHRGPDDTGVLLRGQAGLAMRRLSIIDLQTGHQPMTSESGDVAIVFNGEIYNYRDLRDRLKARGHVLRTTSDTEVVLHLYEDDGFGCLTQRQAGAATVNR